jgi:hypothetical protein
LGARRQKKGEKNREITKMWKEVIPSMIPPLAITSISGS